MRKHHYDFSAPKPTFSGSRDLAPSFRPNREWRRACHRGIARRVIDDQGNSHHKRVNSTVEVGWFHTEEFAELHAIIQAVEYEPETGSG
jgi:hypothetical protein